MTKPLRQQGLSENIFSSTTDSMLVQTFSQEPRIYSPITLNSGEYIRGSWVPRKHQKKKKRRPQRRATEHLEKEREKQRCRLKENRTAAGARGTEFMKNSFRDTKPQTVCSSPNQIRCSQKCVFEHLVKS